MLKANKLQIYNQKSVIIGPLSSLRQHVDPKRQLKKQIRSKGDLLGLSQTRRFSARIITVTFLGPIKLIEKKYEGKLSGPSVPLPSPPPLKSFADNKAYQADLEESSPRSGSAGSDSARLWPGLRRRGLHFCT